MPNVKAAWCGWYRESRRSRWQPVSEGNTPDEAFNRLLDYLDTAPSRGGESMILERGRKPIEGTSSAA
jgi:hypothetical protein